MTFEHSWLLKSEDETAALAREFSLFATAGDWIGLSGDLGAGKTTFARALIRAYCSEPVDVPSPTFTLVQLYDETRIPVAHFDLYRLEEMSEADELGLDDLAGSHLILTEWAERLEDRLPPDRLMIDWQISGEARTAKVTGFGVWQARLERMVRVARFVQDNAPGHAREFLQGDASARRYERLIADDGQSSLLMDMPAKTEPKPADGSASYSQQVHLAEDIRAVLAVNKELVAAGYSAPAILAADIESGFAIVEDFGDAVFGTLENYGSKVTLPIKTAVEVLADMAGRNWPCTVGVDDQVHTMAAFDESALMAEADLLMGWFWPLVTGTEPAADRHSEFTALWQPLLQQVQQEEPVWVMRDYHSPNLIWLDQREGNARVGIIDTQDAVLGSPAYDLAALLQDARVDVSVAVERKLLDHYAACRRACDPSFDETGFRTSYAILGAQRAAKILGIFARLSKRDGKHGYLRHIPRVSAILERNLQHSVLADLKTWFERYLPAPLREAV
ncbi:MAG: tRNA (adenosine(37)-N6)-threonylcarbamoyltransferase complex ATPase subunit type 1 TsaE [Rhizobiales bacterium]|nr:tRNA (adenosine(37)-N6)-threonylcarbamoyltransferase complex ATPase subunit type 1 TsaE [Hyphomicrobiales bacterium]